MRLRVKLFLWVAFLFIVAAVASYYFQDGMTKRHLLVAEKILEQEIMQFDEARRVHMERYLSMELSRIEANIDTLLGRISRTSYLQTEFGPTQENARDRNWLDCSSLMITDSWIDFVQDLNADEITALVSISLHQNEVLHERITPDLILSLVREDEGMWEGPFVGLEVSFEFQETIADKRLTLDAPLFFFLFTPESILNMDFQNLKVAEYDLSLNFLEPIMKWIDTPVRQSFMVRIIEQLKEAQGYLQNSSTDLKASKQKMLANHNKEVNASLTSEGVEISKKLPKITEAFTDQILRKDEQIGLIWGLAAITATGSFQFHPLDPKAPVGMLRIDEERKSATALLSRQVFSNKPFLSLKGCEDGFKVDLGEECISKRIFLIEPPESNQVYFGNSLRMKMENRTGYLTIGVNNLNLLQAIAIATGEVTAFISNGRVVNVMNSDGLQTYNKEWTGMDLSTIMGQKSGVTTVEGKRYFFLHMQPIPEMDFHFFIFNPREEEFALITNIQNASQQLIDTISWNMRLAGLVAIVFVLLILDWIVAKISKPIAHLAVVTQTVAAGRLSEIEIPDVKEGGKDEVKVLYHAFFEMVKGLKEKERVRGILNKVVSPEIAEETLKGNIHLGGEEKLVTVVFADIRHFTTLTEKMPPQEVIGLLNTCMTKVSQIIDRRGGVIDKYVGDEVMALFGAPVSKPESALNGVLCALEIVEAMQEWNRERFVQGKAEIAMGVGVHTGLVVAGNMGAEDRLNYTVVGANVNLAARLCSAAGGMEVYISEETLLQPDVSEHIRVEKVPPIALKGFTASIDIFKVIGKKEPLH
ncbi:MAG: adenylate/guanylate cyclase domain-containing protein [Simkaniaceae bacterium]|nr:adenylate/guanylate cyclase domain-containing protein [Simkaniaceae bacterium]